jgi:hypothetical protein
LLSIDTKAELRTTRIALVAVFVDLHNKPPESTTVGQKKQEKKKKKKQFENAEWS